MTGRLGETGVDRSIYTALPVEGWPERPCRVCKYEGFDWLISTGMAWACNESWPWRDEELRNRGKGLSESFADASQNGLAPR